MTYYKVDDRHVDLNQYDKDQLTNNDRLFRKAIAFLSGKTSDEVPGHFIWDPFDSDGLGEQINSWFGEHRALELDWVANGGLEDAVLAMMQVTAGSSLVYVESPPSVHLLQLHIRKEDLEDYRIKELLEGDATTLVLPYSEDGTQVVPDPSTATGYLLYYYSNVYAKANFSKGVYSEEDDTRYGSQSELGVWRVDRELPTLTEAHHICWAGRSRSLQQGTWRSVLKELNG